MSLVDAYISCVSGSFAFLRIDYLKVVTRDFFEFLYGFSIAIIIDDDYFNVRTAGYRI